jgi:tRNA(Leu) C34 or U34 (ribose-2'-O)-methylase TrmL
MKIHTTNYINTFIEVADDCPTDISEIPKSKGNNKTVAEMQFELIVKNPYTYTSDDILFQVYADRNDLTKAEYNEAREQFFSKGQACFRASPLTKRYGFGVHSDKDGKIAIFGRETKEYEQFINDTKVQKVRAMRTSKK